MSAAESPILDEGPTFVIHAHAAAMGGKTITCKVCKRTSFHPNDAEHRYCGHCHAFHADLARDQPASEVAP